jgi:hypothetical protein
MLNVVMNHNDRIESILPVIRQAMDSGEVCRIQNLAVIGPFAGVAESILGLVDDLLDADASIPVHSGFRLLGVDEHGLTRTLLM